MLPYHTESASSSLPVRSTPPAGHEASRFSPSSSTNGGICGARSRPTVVRAAAQPILSTSSSARSTSVIPRKISPESTDSRMDCSSAVAAKSR
jgi:hypothetical protein